MSYSFSIKASSKDEAGAKVAEELERVVATQPVHARDRQAAQDAAEAFINMLADPGDGECIGVSVSGYLNWRSEGEFTGSSVSIRAGISPA